jgi:hypothetical protein
MKKWIPVLVTFCFLSSMVCLAGATTISPGAAGALLGVNLLSCKKSEPKPAENSYKKAGKKDEKKTEKKSDKKIEPKKGEKKAEPKKKVEPVKPAPKKAAPKTGK